MIDSVYIFDRKFLRRTTFSTSAVHVSIDWVSITAVLELNLISIFAIALRSLPCICISNYVPNSVFPTRSLIHTHESIRRDHKSQMESHAKNINLYIAPTRVSFTPTQPTRACVTLFFSLNFRQIRYFFVGRVEINHFCVFIGAKQEDIALLINAENYLWFKAYGTFESRINIYFYQRFILKFDIGIFFILCLYDNWRSSNVRRFL